MEIVNEYSRVTEGDFSVPDSCMRGAYYKDGLVRRTCFAIAS